MAHAAVSEGGASHGTYASYLTGFALAVLLTAIPFWLVMSRSLPEATIVAIILPLAAVQMLVHLHYFLHLDFSSAQRWNLAAFAFTAVVIVLIIGGSIWIMYNLSQRTMDHTVISNVPTGMTAGQQ